MKRIRTEDKLLRRLMLMLVLSVCCQIASCQTIDSVFTDYRGLPAARYSLLKKAAIKEGAKWLHLDFLADQADRLDSVRVLSLSRCRADVKQHFAEATEDLEDMGYEQQDEWGNEAAVAVRVYTLRDDQGHPETVVRITGRHTMLLQLYGDVDPDVIRKLTDTL
jgi:hypothetical protein